MHNYINHIALVLDASSSMALLKHDVIKVADEQIKHLAQRSKELDQETRVTVYQFADNNKIKCLVYDKDVLRLPSIAALYEVYGNTALIDATLKALEDLEKTPELYGEHAFLTYVITDGQENNSRNSSNVLVKKLNSLKNNWTLACFVPDQNGIFEAKKQGFLPDNISIWSTSQKGMSEVGEVIKRTSDVFLQGRTKGIMRYSNLFTLDASGLSKTSVSNSLDKLGPGQFRLFKVPFDQQISHFVEGETKRAYKLGEGYYQLTKREEIQPQKKIALYEKKTHSVFIGENARKMLKLPDYSVKVVPGNYADYTIFVQSMSVNRKLLKDTSVLVLS